MIDCKLAAVGSSPLIAQEIADAIHFILEGNAVVDVICIQDLSEDSNYDFYVCATTQFEKLQRKLPRKKIMLLELIPTAKFFIAVARIPEGETIYIFNNYLEYTQILGNYCEKLGITDVAFQPIAYREMEEEEILGLLKNARYLIGVDKFIHHVLRATPHYMAALPRDARLIAATRVASVQSGCELLCCIAARLHSDVAKKAGAIQKKLTHEDGVNDALQRSAVRLLRYASQALQIIQGAVLKTALNHIDPDLKKDRARDLKIDAATSADPADCFDTTSTLQKILQVNEQLGSIVQKLTEAKSS